MTFKSEGFLIVAFYIWLPPASYVVFLTTRVFIKTENIAVDEIGRIICSHLLARAHTYFYIKLLWMHDAVLCKIVANYSAAQY